MSPAKTTRATEHSPVAVAFDSIAEIFEQSFENEITRGLRQKAYGAIRDLVPPGSIILDMNCGVGIDALALAQLGYNVTGIDISPKMIEQAKQRASTTVQGLKFYVTSFEDLSPVEGARYDLVLSNFAGLNCVSRLDKVAQEIARVLHPGGYFVAVVMPPISLWEIVAGLAELNFRSAFRRLHKNVQATGFRGGTFPVYYHSPASLTKVFAKAFDVITIQGLFIITPPPHAKKFHKNHPLLSSWMHTIERSLNTAFPFHSVGDHFLAVLQKRHPA
jgi:ubiquinone/menaquinone biosynthesis C-methylase UbiE